ncbi:MAG: helix-turn-helix domain-containing protein [Fibromonadales bacterium]|nr:helix-turn-helix domain-containing protein [Fibromonadales bacterium]
MVEEQESKLSQGADEKVGSYLRRVREARGLELEQLAKFIRLGLNVLQAIEENNWNFFPTEAYLRSYVGSICEKLSIDKFAVLKRLSTEINSQLGVVIQTSVFEEQNSENGLSSGNISKIIIVVILAIFVILFFVNKVLDSYEAKPAPEAPPSVIDEVTPNEEDNAESAPDTSSLQVEPLEQEASIAVTTGPENLNKVDTLRFECSPSPTDDKCGVKQAGVNTAMGWFKNVSYRYITRKDSSQITITVPDRTRLFLNGTRLDYGKFNTLTFHRGQIVNKINRELR